jgi:hypothetical protein
MAINKTKPFETTFTKYDHLDDFFKCVFIRVDKTSSVMDFCSSIQREFNGQPTPDFMPHLSVLYGQMATEEKERIIKSLGKEYQKSFILEKVDVIEYRLGESPEMWKKIGKVQIK